MLLDGVEVLQLHNGFLFQLINLLLFCIYYFVKRFGTIRLGSDVKVETVAALFFCAICICQ